MLRLFALVVVVALAGAGFYLWKVRPEAPWSVPGGGGRLEAVESELRDTRTTASVRTAIALNRTLDPYPVSVATEGGVVTLRGEVPTAELRAKAEAIAGAVPGVRQVVNHLAVEGAGGATGGEEGRTLGESLDDQALAVKVKLAFSLDRRLEGATLRVRSFRRQAIVSGEVDTEEQRRLALAIAAETASVLSVADEVRLRGTAPPRPPAEAPPPPARRPDPAAVARALRANPNLAPYDLRVEDAGGRLVLSGRVRTGAERDLAGLLARDAVGTPVENALEVVPAAR